MKRYNKHNTSYVNSDSPHLILGCGTTLLLAKFKSDNDNTDKEMNPQKEDKDHQKQDDMEIDIEMEENKKELTSKDEQFDLNNLESIKLEIEAVSNFSFTWISKILTFNFKSKYLVIHDLMKGICLLNKRKDNFQFHNEKIVLIESPILLSSH